MEVKPQEENYLTIQILSTATNQGERSMNTYKVAIIEKMYRVYFFDADSEWEARNRYLAEGWENDPADQTELEHKILEITKI